MQIIQNNNPMRTFEDLKQGDVFAFAEDPKQIYLRISEGNYVSLSDGEMYYGYEDDDAPIIILDATLTINS